MDKLLENKQFFSNIKLIIETSQARGCWKPNELQAIGLVWTDLEKILAYVEQNTKGDESTKDDESTTKES